MISEAIDICWISRPRSCMKPKVIAGVTGTTRRACPRLTLLTGQDHATSVVVEVGTVCNRPETGSLSQRKQAQEVAKWQFICGKLPLAFALSRCFHPNVEPVNLQRPDGAPKQRRPTGEQRCRGATIWTAKYLLGYRVNRCSGSR
jgi:hypothetical protein